jgi:uncharacterized repeat protein (TIGR01451 family)
VLVTVALIGALVSAPVGWAAAATPFTPPLTPPTPTCHGLPATIVGTSGNDVLKGTTGNDVIVGSGGNDRIIGNGGTDTICGGGGNDTLLGNKQRDWLDGGDGNDVITGNRGSDVLLGGAGTNRLDGGGGQDVCDVGSAGSETRCESHIGTVIVREVTSPAGAAGFAYGGSLGSFSLNDQGAKTVSALIPGSYGVTQAGSTGPAPGWPLTGLTCVDPSGGTTTAIITRTASISLASGETVICTFTNTAPVIAPQADLSITKTDGVSTVTAGGSTTYTITASNAGPSGVIGATVGDTFPAILSGVSWTCTGAGAGTCPASGPGNINATVDLPSGGSVTFTASATISASATGALSNTATVSAPVGTTDPSGNNSATDSDSITSSADLSITKTDGVSTVSAGGSTTYTITASNAGPSNVTGASVIDTYPAPMTGGAWTCTGSGGGTCPASGSGNINATVNLPSGGSVTFTASATISPSASGTLDNTATVSAPAGTTDPTGNNSATDSDTVITAPSADLSITKTDGVSTVTAGGSTTYTITASNAGPSGVIGATVGDTFPAILSGVSWTCTGAGAGTCPASGPGNINATVDLPSGGSVTFTASATISPSATGALSNTATVSAPAGTTDPSGNNSATDSDSITSSADLSITKTDGVSTVSAGGSTTYTITASNAGPSNVTGATVIDTYPAPMTGGAWTCTGSGGGTCPASGTGDISATVNLPSGGWVTFTASATISPSASGTLDNTATVSAPAGTTDPTGNNSATDSDTVITAPSADLSITKTDGVTSVTAGGSTTYTITASNAGPSGVTGATVGDTFPAILSGVSWTCTGAGGGTCPASGPGNINATVDLPSGGSVTFTASATISASATGALSNTATVSAPAGTTDPSGNNSATDSDSITSSADLSITKTDGVSTVSAGGSTTYTITASNAGPSNVTGATVIDTYPAPMTGGAWTCTGSGGGTCPASGTGDISATVNLPSGGWVTFTASATISPSASGTLDNTATVSAPAGTTDPTGNNSATDSDTVTAASPPDAVDDGYDAAQNVTLNEGVPGVLLNDTLNGASIGSYGASTGTEQTSIGSTTPTAQGGTVTLQATGAFSYSPPTGFAGSDSFKYRLENGALNDTATVSITVYAPPTTVGDAYTVQENVPLSPAAPGVLVNDTPNGATMASYGASTGAEQISIGSSTPTGQGGSVILNANGSFTYNPPLRLHRRRLVQVSDIERRRRLDRHRDPHGPRTGERGGRLARRHRQRPHGGPCLGRAEQ